MIVKQGKIWLVKDSSGKKILGRHDSRKKAAKQLAAIEISKNKKLKEFKDPFYNINNFMNEQNYYKIKCAHLDQYKKELQEKLNILEALTTSNTSQNNQAEQEEETPATTPPFKFAPADMAGQQSQQQQQYTPSKKKIKKGGQEEESGKTKQLDVNNPLEFAQAHMGIALTPQSAQGQVNVLSQYYDNPETEEKETPESASWQNVNTAISNYMGSEVNKLMRQQRMA